MEQIEPIQLNISKELQAQVDLINYFNDKLREYIHNNIGIHENMAGKSCASDIQVKR